MQIKFVSINVDCNNKAKCKSHKKPACNVFLIRAITNLSLLLPIFS